MLEAQLHKILHGRHRAARQYRPLNVIEIDSKAALHNVKLIANQHPGIGVIPVLKANAYGHGLEEMSEVLNNAECQFLAVDGYFEAAKIRYLAKHPILVLGVIRPENVHLLDTKRCSFVVQDIAGLEAFGRSGRPVKIHMELNTGMNRLGLQAYEIDEYLKTLRQFSNLHLEGVMTHLADADNEKDNSFTEGQVKTFDTQVERIRDAGFTPKFIHVAQTAGSTKAKSKYANGIRLGIGLYGINPLTPKDPHFKDLANLKPVLELTSTIIKIIDLKPGDRVSYNGIFNAERAMRIGVLPLGYYEGVPRELSNIGVVTHGQKVLPIVGRVCMNHTMIDITTTNLMPNDSITVISRNPSLPNNIAHISATHKLFSYSLLTDLSNSIRRVVY